MNIKSILKIIAILPVLIFLSSNAYAKNLSEICSDNSFSECLITEAEKLVGEISDVEKRKINQAVIATSWSTIGSNDKAMKILKDIGDVSKISSAFARASILGDMSLIYAKNGDQEKSKLLGVEASKETIRINDHFDRAVVLFGIGYNQIESGNLRQAKLITDSLTAMIRLVSQPEAQLLLVASTAWLHAKLKNEVAAKSVLNSIESGLNTMVTNLPKVAAYSYFGAASGLVGNNEKSDTAISQAKQLTRKIDNPLEQLTALTIMLDAQNDLMNEAQQKESVQHIIDIIDLTQNAENKIWALTVTAIASSEL
ncbi:MAG: hypothetical protein CMF53_02475 [Legionellales bacterium]|jgi:hypothetical protein|nr:hypothetical protein [Legionellales bacterium]|tara:strand:+ start:1657 stop:2592 length:936 start_codon:yes stop_codon:yes gene_type:complete